MDKKKGKKTAVIISSVAILALVLVIVFDALLANKNYQKSASLMNTVVSVNIDGKKSEQTGERILKTISDLDVRLLSRHIKSTDVSILNQNAGEFKETDPLVAELAKRCNELNQKSNGAFNPLLGKISDMWGFGTENAHVPNEKEIKEGIEKAQRGKIEIDAKNVKIPQGTAFDLGAVGKGIACDESRKILAASKTKRAVISVGGSVLLFGEGEKFNVGVRNPFGSSNDIVGTLTLSDTCVSTSGSYERFFEENGKTYHHILNPENGYPVKSELVSVTVISKDGFLSDALSTACFVLGCEDSQSLLKQYDAQAIFIFKDKSIKLTDGAKSVFTLSDKSFKLI